MSNFIIDPALWLYGTLDHSEYFQRYAEIIAKVLPSDFTKFINNQLINANDEEIMTWVDQRQTLYEFFDIDTIKTKLKTIIGYPFVSMAFTVGGDMFVTERDWIQDYITFNFICALGSQSPKLAAWIAGQETDLFMKRFIMNKQYHRDQILKWLFTNEIQFHQNRIKIKWWLILSMMEREPSYTLENGFVVVNKESPIGKKIFNIVLHKRVYDLFLSKIQQFKLPKNLEIKYKPIADDLKDVVIVEDDFHTSLDRLPQILAYSPLCIIDIFDEIQSGFDPGYNRALQLSFYMKQFFELDNLKLFWWENDARNKRFKSVDEMMSSISWLRRHYESQYGYESGRGTNYSMMKCDTCANSGTGYRCYFTDSDIEHKMRKRYADELENKETASIAETLIQIITASVNRNKPQYACMMEFILRFLSYIKLSINKPKIKDYFEYIRKTLPRLKRYFFMIHPLTTYYKNAIDLGNILTENAEKEARSADQLQ